MRFVSDAIYNVGRAAQSAWEALRDISQLLDWAISHKQRFTVTISADFHEGPPVADADGKLCATARMTGGYEARIRIDPPASCPKSDDKEASTDH